jgi:hypothetical protein
MRETPDNPLGRLSLFMRFRLKPYIRILIEKIKFLTLHILIKEIYLCMS